MELFTPFEGRERLFTRRHTFWAFIGQVLGDGQQQGSLREALRHLQANRRAVQGEDESSHSTSSLCTARQRLQPALLDKVESTLRGFFEGWQLPVAGLEGRRIRLLDATTVTAPDTEPNQVSFPQPVQCQAGCGFPLLRLTALLDLNTGTWVKTSITSTETSELGAA